MGRDATLLDGAGRAAYERTKGAISGAGRVQPHRNEQPCLLLPLQAPPRLTDGETGPGSDTRTKLIARAYRAIARARALTEHVWNQLD